MTRKGRGGTKRGARRTLSRQQNSWSLLTMNQPYRPYVWIWCEPGELEEISRVTSGLSGY